ncbi:MotA/TolQ/ExbB proton channel family protein [Myxococcota bacterium]|nr:MotA/TolQ/ExbB proton channel family protein [Myxococcota bacterium]
MQIIGFAVLSFVVWFGFADRADAQISAFDSHALVMVLVGSTAAIMISSSRINFFRTITILRELIPNWGTMSKETARAEAERKQLIELWTAGNRAQAVALAEKSSFDAIQEMLKLILSRAPKTQTSNAFLELRHEELTTWQPAVGNWEMLSKLGPSFGMIGTITGMIQLFKNMGSGSTNIGAAMSLALLATLYGVAFGAGVAGPIGHFLNSLLDERMGFLDRCAESVDDVVARSVG